MTRTARSPASTPPAGRPATSEEDRAGVNEANRSCWAYPGGSDTNAACFGPHLDQLLNPDGAPDASFWTMTDYSTMAGTRVWSDSNDTNLSNVAVTDGAGRTRTLLGRHQTCSGWTAGAAACPVLSQPEPDRTVLAVLVPLDAAAVTVKVQERPDTLSDMSFAPAHTTSSVPITHGLATVSIPAFKDGEAYCVTVNPRFNERTNSGQGHPLRRRTASRSRSVRSHPAGARVGQLPVGDGLPVAAQASNRPRDRSVRQRHAQPERHLLHRFGRGHVPQRSPQRSGHIGRRWHGDLPQADHGLQIRHFHAPRTSLLWARARPDPKPSATPPTGPASDRGPRHHLGRTCSMETDQIEQILRTYDTIVVVGASNQPAKPAHYVPAHMQARGWRIVPVNPREDEILGERVYRCLAEVPPPLGLVNVFRPSAMTPEVARQAADAGAPALWLQLGIASAEARRIATEAGMLYVEDRCLLVEQRRLGLSAPAAST